MTPLYDCDKLSQHLSCGKDGTTKVYAIVETGGKQYRVEPDSIFQVEKLEGKKGDEVILTNVLMVEKMGEKKIGTPYIYNARVRAEIVDQGKDKKILVFKYKPKKSYRVKNGHRQPFTKLKVKEIVATFH